MSEVSPYFSLAQDKSLRSPTPKAADRVRKQNVKSIIEVFGEFAKMDDEKQANFLLQLLSHSSFQPDFVKMADQLEIQHPIAIQRRFEAIARKNGYALEEGKVIPKETGGSLEVPAQQIIQRQNTTDRAAASKLSNNRKSQSKSGSKKHPPSSSTSGITKAGSKDQNSARKTKAKAKASTSIPSCEETTTNFAVQMTSAIGDER